MVGWHHWLDGHGFGWTLGVGDGQGDLACCSSWGCKESDTTERLNWTELLGVLSHTVTDLAQFQNAFPSSSPFRSRGDKGFQLVLVLRYFTIPWWFLLVKIPFIKFYSRDPSITLFNYPIEWSICFRQVQTDTYSTEILRGFSTGPEQPQDKTSRCLCVNKRKQCTNGQRHEKTHILIVSGTINTSVTRCYVWNEEWLERRLKSGQMPTHRNLFLIFLKLKDNCFIEFCCFLSNLNMNQP